MDSYFFRFRLRGLVQPGWIFSSVRRQRESFSVMDSTVAVEPTGTRGDKVEHEARVALEPVPYLLVLVGSIVVHDEKLLMAMTLVALADHFPL